MRLATLISGLALMLVVTASASAQRQQLRLGARAPGLDIEEWVKGEETAIQNGTTYVIDFWDPASGNSQRLIPRLSEHLENYEDKLVIIGVTNQSVEVARPFVRQMGGRMTYTVAVDRRGQTNRRWTQAAGLEAGSATFIVDVDGVIQFMGNASDPSSNFDDILDRVIDGRYDARLEVSTVPLRKEIEAQRRIRNYREAERLMNELLDTHRRIFAYTTIDLFEMKLLDQKDKKLAYDFARTVMEEYSGDSALIEDFALLIATSPKIEDADRDLDLALEMSEVAAAGWSEEQPDRYAVPARVHFARNELDQAIRLQRKAFFVAKPKNKATYERTLRQFQQAARRAASRIDD